MKKDLLLVIVVAALAGAAFFLGGERGSSSPPGPRAADPYRPEAEDPFLASYKVEGGLSTIQLFEAAIRGPGHCQVRYQIRGRPLVERAYPLSDAQFLDLLDRLSRTNFFDVEEVPRSGYHADMAAITVALTLREEENAVRVDARRRASKDITPVLDFFDGLRKQATPESVSSGD